MDVLKVPSDRWLRPIGVCLLLFWILAVPPGSGAQAKTAAEYELRAAFVYNFAKFVEWPAESFDNSGSPIQVCIAGDALVAEAFQNVLGSKTVNKRELLVRRLTKTPELRTCQILYDAGDAKGVPLADSAATADVLSVGESEEFAARGGMIRLLRQGDRLRFLIYRENVERSHLKVSSKLLALSAERSKSPEK